ncbi:MAG: hypothetical protein WBX11_03815 [Thiobacillaceae bacterium]|jgi:hypothetical protein
MRLAALTFAAPRCFVSVILAVVLLAGCADFCRDMYDGIRARNEALRHPAGDERPPMPDYDSYQREREKLKKELTSTQ